MSFIDIILSKIFKKKEEKIEKIEKIYVSLEPEEIFEEEIEIEIRDFSDIDKIIQEILQMEYGKVKKLFENLIFELGKEEIKKKLILDPFKQEAEKIYKKYEESLKEYLKIRDKIKYREEFEEIEEIIKNILPLESYLKVLDKRIDAIITYLDGLVSKMDEYNYKKIAKDIIEILKNLKMLKDREILKIWKNVLKFSKTVNKIIGREFDYQRFLELREEERFKVDIDYLEKDYLTLKNLIDKDIDLTKLYRLFLALLSEILRSKRMGKKEIDKIRKLLYNSYNKFKRKKLDKGGFRKILKENLEKIEKALNITN